jgi:SAM-dependent methyltransferase
VKPTNVHSRFFPEVRAGGFSRVDGTVQFYQRVNALLSSRCVVLDFGAGRGVGHLEDAVPYRQALRNLKGKVREVVGADIDPVVKTNPSLDRAVVIEQGGRIPLPDQSVDMIVSDFTFEHIANPAPVATELERILAEDGWICARTPNRWGYIGMANRLIPAVLRMRVLKLAQPQRHEQDVFPAVYRLNTPKALRRAFDPARFEHSVYALDSEPAYSETSRALYRIFLIIHAITPAPYKSMLYIFIHKKKRSQTNVEGVPAGSAASEVS